MCHRGARLLHGGNSGPFWVGIGSTFVASWYRPPGGDSEKLKSQLALFESQLEKIKDMHKGNKLPSVHILGDFNFCNIGLGAKSEILSIVAPHGK